MKKYIKYIIMTSLLATSYACTNLEEDIQEDFTKEFKEANPGVGVTEKVDDGLGAAFTKLFDGTANHGSYFSISEVSTDEVVITQKGGDWFDGGIWIDMHQHTWQSTNDGFNNAWKDIYGGVTQCNELLAKAETNAGNKAQLKVLRAYLYWRLMDLFGRVKIITAAGTDVAQSERPAAFKFIEDELLAAIPNLSVDKQGYGRVNASGAYSLLARLYLNAEIYTGTARWQDAIDAADNVINSGLYELDPDYAKVFAPTNTNNMEHIWIVPFDQATGKNMNFAQMTLHYPSQLTYRLQQQPWNGYSTLEAFYKSYTDKDKRKANNFVAGAQYDEDGKTPIYDLAFDQADKDGAAINYVPEINELFPNGSRQGGARLGKFSFKKKQLSSMDNDYPIFRYGEVLLTKAEAEARLSGNWGNATTLMLVNRVRERAGVEAYTTLDETEFLAERGREMFQESSRRTDLIRFKAWGKAWWAKNAHSDVYKNIFPIPNLQIQASASEKFPLVQNEGYK